MVCPHCADGIDHELARRIRVLQLLALMEHPDALPADAALRIGRELLAWIAEDEPGHRCMHEIAAEPARKAAA